MTSRGAFVINFLFFFVLRRCAPSFYSPDGALLRRSFVFLAVPSWGSTPSHNQGRARALLPQPALQREVPPKGTSTRVHQAVHGEVDKANLRILQLGGIFTVGCRGPITGFFAAQFILPYPPGKLIFTGSRTHDPRMGGNPLGQRVPTSLTLPPCH